MLLNKNFVQSDRLRFVRSILLNSIYVFFTSLLFFVFPLIEAHALDSSLKVVVQNRSSTYPGYAPDTLSLGVQATNLSNVTNVKFYDNNVLVATAPNIFTPIFLENVSAGMHSFYATATADSGTYTSDTVSYKVNTPYPSMTGSYSRTSAFDYDPISGLLIKEIIEPDEPNLCQVTTYNYDSFGNKTSASTRNCNGSVGSVPGSNSESAAPAATITDSQTQQSIPNPAIIEVTTSSTSYDTQGRFAVSSTNALGQTETRTYNTNLGTVATLTGPNGLSTNWTYDSFGKVLSESRADGTSTTTTYTQCVVTDNNCIANTSYTITTTQAGAPTSVVSYNINSAVIQTATQDKDGNSIYAVTEYDKLGRTLRSSRPFKANATIVWTSMIYDILGRVTSTSAYDGTVSTATYDGLTTTYTNAKGQTKVELKNTQAQLVLVTDANGKKLKYTYDSFGNLVQTNDWAGNTTRLAYDKRGRKLMTDDPGMGVWVYQYDALSQLKRQVDAKGQLVTFVYDKLGRMTQRNEPDLISTWVYDTCDTSLNPAGKCKGKVVQESSDNGYTRTYLYDSYGRITAEKDNVDTAYYVSKSYDNYGRVSNIVYPNGLQITNSYSSSGHLVKVSNTTAGGTYWQAGATDAEGRINQFTYGNNVTTTTSYDQMGHITQINAGASNSISNQSFVYDSIGNLTQRYDGATNLNEAFGYDSLNRLTSTSAQAGSGPLTQVSLTYNEIGNILTKSDVGAYQYGNWVGGRNNPHSVSQIIMNDGTTVYGQFTYDLNGNMLSGMGRSISWNSWNMPSTIVGSTANKSTPEPKKNARYVMIKRNDEPTASSESNSQGLVLAEVKILNSAGTNLAVNKTATSSPAYSAAYPASRAVDGVNTNSDTSFFMGTRDLSTANNTNAWIQIDLGSVQDISQITTLGRTDSASWQNGLFTVFWSEEDMRGKTIEQLKAQSTVSYYVENTQANSTTINVVSSSSGFQVVYNASHERIKEVLPDGTNVYNISPRVDTGIHVEKRVKPDGTVQLVSSLYAVGNMPFATITTTTKTINKGPFPAEPLSSTKTRYFHTDHLGSIVAITDEAGNVTERRSYDAWGKRRNLNGTKMSNAFVTPDERHGFTGHEEWDEVGLIHMNGRLYDPTLGRFLSADPTIQYPDDKQSYNRYSYINNNPLSAVDYSGYGFWKSIKKAFKKIGKAITSVVKSVEHAVSAVLSNTVIRTAASIAASIYLGPQSGYALFASDQVVANTVVASFTSSLIAGRGDLKAALQGAVTSVAFYGVGGTFTGQFENTIAHAVVGCAASVAGGGSCKSGALAGGFSAAAANYGLIKSDWGVVGGTVASAVIGGTASVLGGGKFENGAMTGAFGYLFNCWNHPGTCNAQDKEELIEKLQSQVHDFGCIKADITMCLGPGTIQNSGIKVSAELIKNFLASDATKITQQGVSLPAVQRYVDRLLKGDIAPAIKMDGDTIVDGVHRYIAGKIVGKPPAVSSGTVAPSRVTRPISDVKVDPADWGNF